MYIKKIGSLCLLVAVAFVGTTTDARAYGPEGLFGGRPMPDNTIILGNPVDLRNERPDRAEHVLEYPRPDFDGVPYEVYGGFEFYPTLEFGAAYDSNIYVENRSQSIDSFETIRPIVNLFSNWGRHALSITTFGDINYYSQHGKEGYKNFVLDVNGRYDIANKIWVGARGGYQRLAESRTSPNAVNGSEPTTFGLLKGGLTFYRGVGKLKVNVDYDYKRFDYDDTPSSLGTIDQSIRDRNEHYFGGKLAYSLTGNMKPYIRAGYNIRDYDNNPLHKAHGWESVLGFEADFGGITSVDLFIGWMQQNHDDFAVKKSVGTPKIGARVDWNVTGLTSIVFEANRTIEETTLFGYNSFYQTGGSVTATHELLRNILLEGNVAYSYSDFIGSGDRSDQLFSTGLGLRYLVNRSIYTDFLYGYESRTSNEANVDYTRHVAIARVGVHF